MVNNRLMIALVIHPESSFKVTPEHAHMVDKQIFLV